MEKPRKLFLTLEDGTQAGQRNGPEVADDGVVRPQSVLRAYLATRRSHRPRLQVGGEPEKSVSVGGAVERVGRIEHPNVAPDQEVLREQETSKARESRRPPQQNANNCNQRPPGATARPAHSCFRSFAACFARSLLWLLRPFRLLSLLCCFAALLLCRFAFSFFYIYYDK